MKKAIKPSKIKLPTRGDRAAKAKTTKGSPMAMPTGMGKGLQKVQKMAKPKAGKIKAY